MLPLLADPRRLRVVLVGAGEALRRRRRLLAEAGVTGLRVFGPDDLPSGEEIAAAHLLFVAGLPRALAADLAARARAARVLVHVEDAPALSDLHAPSVMRRGDLTIAVSTNGRSPGLARRVRRHIEELFGAEWGDRIEELGILRQHWRANGADMREVARRTEDWVDRYGWLAAGRPAAEDRNRRTHTNPVHQGGQSHVA